MMLVSKRLQFMAETSLFGKSSDLALRFPTAQPKSMRENTWLRLGRSSNYFAIQTSNSFDASIKRLNFLPILALLPLLHIAGLGGGPSPALLPRDSSTSYYAPFQLSPAQTNQTILPIVRESWQSIYTIEATFEGMNSNYNSATSIGSSHYLKVKSKIREIAERRAGDVSEAAMCISEDVLDLLSGFRLPQIVPSADGGIIFLWSSNDRHFELSIEPDKHLVWFSKIDGDYIPGDDVIWNNSVPPSLLSMLREIQSHK